MMTDEMQRAPVPCPEMTNIRAQIDRLDRDLVRLLAQRQKLIAGRSGQTAPRPSARSGAY